MSSVTDRLTDLERTALQMKRGNEKINAQARRMEQEIRREIDRSGREWVTCALDFFDDLGSAAAALAAANAYTDSEIAALSTVYAPLLPITVISTDALLAANNRYVVDSSGGVKTPLLPPSPAHLDHVSVKRMGANNVVVDRNGNNIEGAAANFTLTVDLMAIDFYFVTGQGWLIF